jgi:hypothetical protein
MEAALAEAEGWDLQDLMDALLAGLARPLGTARGGVIDPERERLSATLEALAREVAEAARRYWMAGPSPAFTIPPACRRCLPSLELVVELERFANATRMLAQRLRERGV